MNPPLKSGYNGSGDWRHINRVAAGADQTGQGNRVSREYLDGRRRLLTPIGGGGGGGNWNYRGMWSATPSSAYMTFDVVSFGSGSSSGMYLSTVDTNINEPDTGIGWLQVSSSAGAWL